MLRHAALLYLVQAAPASPDLGWLTDMAARLLLVIQIVITGVIGARIAGDAGGAAIGGKSARIAAKEVIAERLGWLGVVWVVGFIVTVALWVVGR
jgi:hypothetical protein